jgi:DNA-binding XRE family transcriptional regulator
MTSTPALAVGWGESLKAARIAFPTDDEHELTQDELAEMVGVAQNTISRIENGKQLPGDDTRIALARALDKDVEVLFPYKPFVEATIGAIDTDVAATDVIATVTS